MVYSSGLEIRRHVQKAVNCRNNNDNSEINEHWTHFCGGFSQVTTDGRLHSK